MMECVVLKTLVSTAMWTTIPVNCFAEDLTTEQWLPYINGASQQVEVYIGHSPRPKHLIALAGLAERDLAVSVLISPDVPTADELVDVVSGFFADAPGDPPTICVLAAPAGEESVVVIDHLAYRDDFDPSEAVGFTIVADDEWKLVQFPDSQVLADKTEALSGNCRT